MEDSSEDESAIFITQSQRSENAAAVEGNYALTFWGFRKPITSVECEKFEESWVSDSSRRKWAWVLKVFDQWMVERNKAVNEMSYSGEPLINENLDEMSEEQLDFVLARFIAEVRKEDGQEYPGKTLYEMISSIQTFLRVKCKRNNLTNVERCPVELYNKIRISRAERNQ
ncbi:unnamed protein product [Pocillopora meandrina]|uniref:QRICH1-like domain-containing protein n=1 Tax=Pocillopora meandrina TaxID=46732 RepID=A0AAU9WCP1_9CNID|nr:unnamed protein product [Pocillopora meandrina]